MVEPTRINSVWDGSLELWLHEIKRIPITSKAHGPPILAAKVFIVKPFIAKLYYGKTVYSKTVYSKIRWKNQDKTKPFFFYVYKLLIVNTTTYFYQDVFGLPQQAGGAGCFERRF